MPQRYVDLCITDDDMTLDHGGQPLMVDGRASIAQDIKHMIRETGILVELVGNRDAGTKESAVVRLTIEVEDDDRIVPGSVQITEPRSGQFYLLAQTVEFGDLAMQLEAEW